MHLTRNSILGCLLAFLMLMTTAVAAYAAVPADAAGNWAHAAIDDLIQRGILTGYPDHTFKPDQPVTRAEFAKMAATAFDLTSKAGTGFSDTAGHWAEHYIEALVDSGALSGYADGSFRPDSPITRSDAIVAFNSLLHLGTKDQTFGSDWTSSFADISTSNPDFRQIELSSRLGYLPPSYGEAFQPEASVTRAEAAWMLDRILSLKRSQGTVQTVNPQLGTILVTPSAGGNAAEIEVDPEALILRNNSAVPLEQILADDQVVALSVPGSDAKVIMATGQVNANDLYSRLKGWTKGALTPETAAALVNGDWGTVQNGLKNVLFDRLLQMGLDPGQAQSLLDSDWTTLDLLSRDQLVQALSSTLGLSTDMSKAILWRDLPTIKQLLQSKLTSVALGRLLQFAS